MKLFIVVLSLAVVVVAKEAIFADYHLEIGIPERARIDAAESAADFDGSRIIGGQMSALGDNPFLAGLQVTLLNTQVSVCGASLISPNTLVGAAHCWRSNNFQAFLFVVILGSVNYNFGGVRRNTNTVFMHPDYDMDNLNNDVAVIRISVVTLTPHIATIALATGSDTYVGSIATAAGFGRTTNTGPVSNRARHVNLQVIDNPTCASVYYPGTVIESTLCTSNSDGRSTCGGDSGGPLAIGNTLIGISSFVSARGCTLAPAGFARVTSFVSWIRAQ